jgi:succinoglycan biosynthesis protein ExoA
VADRIQCDHHNLVFRSAARGGKRQVCPRPLVTVILPVLNEERFIERALRSILGQETPDFDLEILVIDGQSIDNTPRIVSTMAIADSRIRLVVNQMKKTPFALNIGLREAKGEYVGILGAHAVYERNYVSACLKELLSRGAVGCSGRVITRPSNNTLQARLVAWTFAHPFGSSSKSFRTQREGYVDSVAYPVMLRHAVLDAGGYNECLVRNQDNDMNQRLRAKGYKFFCTWKTRCIYYPVSTNDRALRYAFRQGFWNLISLRDNPSSLGIHHFVPFVFLTVLIIALVLATVGLFLPAHYSILLLTPFAALMALHLGLGIIAAIQVGIRERSFGAWCLPFTFLALHLSYGAGTMSACLTRAISLIRAPILESKKVFRNKQSH